jgi:hypothetical protein
VVQPHGFADELRGVLRADGRPCALLALFRAEGEPAFEAHESALVASLSAPLAGAVRERARSAAPAACHAAPYGPGVMLFAPGGELISVNADALAWLDELTSPAGEDDAFALPLPTVVVSTLMRARAIEQDRERGSARARLRSRATGRWLVCHASCMHGRNGEIGNAALIIEPAQAAEIAYAVAGAGATARTARALWRASSRCSIDR